MAAQRGERLPQLSIATNFNPAATVVPGMFSPAMQHFHPMQTPMQPFFATPPIPSAPQRPTHRTNQASVQLAAAGILPPSYMTPVAAHFPRSSMALPGHLPQLLPPSFPFPNRGRRQLSIGGPPKAALGGPARKLSPLPQPVVPTPIVTEKKKKIVVNLPKKTNEELLQTRSEWEPQPLSNSENDSIVLTEISTAEIYPPDSWRAELPDVIDVYLPGKAAWEAIKRIDIEAKLEKLGIERGSGSNVPFIHAPHARAASISSPADPALLLFKLNKLHQQQEISSTSTNPSSLSVSPQPPFVHPPFGLSPSPHRLTTSRLGQHAHTVSLAQPPSFSNNSLLSGSSSLFGGVSNGVVDNEFGAASSSSLALDARRPPIDFMPPPLSAVGAHAPQIDFARGFGLDIPLESEEEDEDLPVQKTERSEDDEEGEEVDSDDGFDVEVRREIDDATTTPGESRWHSRHVSRVSAALSLRSVGGNFHAQFESAQQEIKEREDDTRADEIGNHSAQDEEPEEDEDEIPRPNDPAGDWTGSEDLGLRTDPSDNESIGEYSNPSDEERVRQQRSERRMRRRTDKPRRLPEFPWPPGGKFPREDEDIISNPSEENLIMARRAEFLGVSTETYYPESSLGGGTSVFGLSVDAHSRVASGQYSAHDPALAHSRQASGSQRGNKYNHDQHQSMASGDDVKRDALNPFAKPFVFGPPRLGESQSSSGVWQPFKGEDTPPMPIPSVANHSRMPSIGKPLSANAPEFKPGQFNFKLPGAPQMPVTHLPVVPPIAPLSPIDTSSPFRIQGREKRQRTDSSLSHLGENGMSSFKFPPSPPTGGKTGHRQRQRSNSLDLDLISGQTHLNPSAHPFTFAEFSTVTSNMPSVLKESDVTQTCEEGDSSVTAKVDDNFQWEKGEETELSANVSSSKARVPIPLDFKHPSNTVPAGLFKALASNSDERIRRGVRSRLGSRETFDHAHRPSVDDTDIPLIARKASRKRLLSDPKEPENSRMHEFADDDDVFASVRPHARRRSSLPDALIDNKRSPSSSGSNSAYAVGPQDLTGRMEVHRLESVIGQLLDEKLRTKRELPTEADMGVLVADLISALRKESVARNLEDSRLDAKGEIDFQLIKDVIERSHQETLSTFQREVQRISVGSDVISVIDGATKRTVNAVVEALSEFSARQEAISYNLPSRERDLMVEKLTNVLSPMIESLHSDPIDYEFLTRELAQAVKPHIAQLIDLASDKRETATLIVDKILPLLPTLNNSFDVDAVTLKLVTEVRKAIAPIDAFEIKEQVADLVVERLDSRFAVRDKAFNVDVVTSKVMESMSDLVDPRLGAVSNTVEEIVALQKANREQDENVSATLKDIFTATSNVSREVKEGLEGFKATQDQILDSLARPVPLTDPDPSILVIRNAVEGLEDSHRTFEHHTQEILLQSKSYAEKLNTLPNTLTTCISGLRESLAELITSDHTSKTDIEELRKLNTEYQLQVNKARSLYGQVRVEKDALSEKLALVEADRDRLRGQIKDLEASASDKATETNGLAARNAELEDALTKALSRLHAADVATQADQTRIADLEKTNTELNEEKQNATTRLVALEAEIGFINREKESVVRNLEALQKQHEPLVLQQRNWDTLNDASEKINMVYKLLENADEEDQLELRSQRERTRLMEADNVALQKRLKEADLKLNNATNTLHTLTQTQQRSTEWERRAKEYEGQLELVQTKLEQSEQTHSQLEADYNLGKLQLEETLDDSRLIQDQGKKLREQIGALEAKCVRLQNELEKANNAAKLGGVSTPFRPHNGVAHPPRSESRASTAYDTPANRRVASSTNNQKVSSKSSSSNSASHQTSVWDSMHAPSTNGYHENKWESMPNSVHSPLGRYPDNAPSTPKPRRQVYNIYQRGAPSPTPSVVSAAPTMGNDGWWS